MNKMLDYLNERNIEVNTLEGAKKALEILLRNHPDRVAHSKEVAKKALEICGDLDKEKVEIAALLHDIGYSEDFRFADFHPVDGYYYLMANGWEKVYQEVALFHTFSKNLANMYRPDLKQFYEDREPMNKNLEIIYVITKADFSVDKKGNRVTYEERYSGILEEYGEDSPIAKHALSVLNKLNY